MDASPTGFYRVVQKVSDVIPVLGIMSRLPFLFPRASSSVVMYVENRPTHIPTRWPRGFYRVGEWAKKFDKIQIFDYLQTLRITATAKNRAIQAAYILFNRPCTPYRNPVKPMPVKKLCRMRMAGLCQFYWRTCSFFFWFLCQGHRSHCASDLDRWGLKTRRSAQGSAFWGSERCAPKLWG